MGRAAASLAGPRQRAVGLEDLGSLGGGAIGLFASSAKSALFGVAGLVDWRLDGALGRARVGGLAGGGVGDVLLLPAHGRLAPGRVFLFGLGEEEAWDDARLATGLVEAVTRMRRAGAVDLVLGAPACRRQPEVEGRFLALAGRLAPAGLGEVLRRREEGALAGRDEGALGRRA